jgi:death-on-curing family protein
MAGRRVKTLVVDDVRHISHALAVERLTGSEPIPPFDTRYPGKLESCLQAPLQTYGRRDLYPGLVRKAAILFYLMVKNHPFENGNKRIAVVTLFIFLMRNGRWITVSERELYQFAVTVAESRSEYKDSVVQIIETFIRRNLTEFKA